MSLIVKDRYAGEAAWKEWFEICSVAGCGAENAAKLRSEIESAMLTQLARYGVSVDEAGGDDPVAFFDGYFMLKGSRDKAKPLKSYFAYRIAADGLSMLNFVCGTLFGSGSGRIHDIVLDWIATLKGWRPRSLRGADGRRRLEWENAGPEAVSQLEVAAEDDPASTVEADGYREFSEKLLNDISRKIKTEKAKVAFLLFATAQDVSITDATVLKGLETGKSRAYAIRDKAMSALRRELRDFDGAGDPLFVRMLLETCEAALPQGVLAKLGGAR